MTTTKGVKQFKKNVQATFRLSFEQALSDKLATYSKRFSFPTWTVGGEVMTSVIALTKALRLGELRDYIKIADTVEALGEEYGFCSKGHTVQADTGPLHLDKLGNNETPCIYLNKVDEVVRKALPRKGPKRLSEFWEERTPKPNEVAPEELSLTVGGYTIEIRLKKAA